MTRFFALLNEGGALFMYIILGLLILTLILIAKGFIQSENKERTIKLISSVGLFTIVFGFLGQTIGLIEAFDAIEGIGDISPALIAGGLKVSLLAPVFGIITFLIARLGIILLLIIK